MPQTYQSPVRIYKYPFELVMKAYHRRFPTCPQIPIFVGSEIIYEYHSPDGAEEIIERKCQLNLDAPYLLKKVAGIEFVYFMQRNHLNLRDRTLNIEASNISFSTRVVVIENCKYYVHNENPDWTCFEQSASLDVKSFFGFESTVEKIAVKHYAANIAKGKEILEYFIDDLIKEGVTEVPRWKSPVTNEISGLPVDEAASGSFIERANNHRSPADSAIEVTSSKEGSQHDVADAYSIPDQSVDAELVKRASSPLIGTSEEIFLFDLQRRRSGSTKQRQSGKFQRQSSVLGELSAESKLEADYIQRFLGQLTPLEESRLCELKYGLHSTHKGKIPNDAHLLRFLRARDFDVQKATQMILNSLIWRKQHNVDKILNDFVPPEVLVKYLPGGWHHSDVEGRPIYVLCLGEMDIKGLLRSVGLENIVKYVLSICEQGLIKVAEATQELGKPLSTWSLLVDLEGLSLRHLWRPGVQCLLRIIETLEAHYPETLGLVLVTRAPRVFPVLWTLISPFIDENTTKKFVFNSERVVLAELEKYIPRSFLPDFLGGPCPFESQAGSTPGHVPKKNYLPLNDEILRGNEDILKSTYRTAVVIRGVPQDTYVFVSEKGSVITWDFDIIKGDCEFMIYYSAKKLDPPAQEPSHPPTIDEFPTVLLNAAAEAVDRVTAEVVNLLSSGSNTTSQQISSKASTDTGELSPIRERTLFGEGDSMQGSLFCEKSGTYVLQWCHPLDSKVLQSSTATQHTSKMAQPNHNQASTSNAEQPSQCQMQYQGKCRLQYFYEVLDSHEFRGSVASLSACRESFSSLTEASPKPNIKHKDESAATNQSQSNSKQ